MRSDQRPFHGVALFDYVLKRDLGIGKCVEIMPKEGLNASRPRLHLRVVIDLRAWHQFSTDYGELKNNSLARLSGTRPATAPFWQPLLLKFVRPLSLPCTSSLRLNKS
jgi:hypothetical protein